MELKFKTEGLKQYAVNVLKFQTLFLVDLFLNLYADS